MPGQSDQFVPHRLPPVLLALVSCTVVSGCAGESSSREGSGGERAAAATAPTFARDVAPIILAKCYRCHREGESAPFELRTFDQVRLRGEQIAEVTGSRFMPPWKPVPGFVRFQGEMERRLSDEEVGVIRDWVAGGMPPGDLREAPEPPVTAPGWQLGEPDLVARLERPYTMVAEGPDVYRLFTLDLPVDRPHYVKAVEFRPGNYRVSHHAFLFIDKTDRSRRLDEADPEPGFDEMNGYSETAQRPDGILLGWQVGRLPTPPQEGIRWRLDPGDDLVIELHMQASGKPEEVQPVVGFYFANDPPTKFPEIVSLYFQDIDIPAGAAEYALRNEYKLPLDVHAMSVLPHAHYLGKRLHAWATLPNGDRRWLVRIDDWDFAWQSDYVYEEPIFLPAGTVITQHFVYDNSADNPRNPNVPPRRVVYGNQTSDEMGELHLQVLCSDKEAARRLKQDNKTWQMRRIADRFARLVAADPTDARARLELAKARMSFNELDEAGEHARRAVELQPDNADARYYLGYFYLLTNKLIDAEAEFRVAVRLDPRHYRAQSSLAKVHLDLGRPDVAAREFEAALALNPDDPFAHSGLAQALLGLGRLAEALEHLEAAVRLRPEMKGAEQSARQIRAYLESRRES